MPAPLDASAISWIKAFFKWNRGSVFIMYCRSCLASNPEGAQKCIQCGAPLIDAIPPPAASPSLEMDRSPAAPRGQASQDPGPTLPQSPPPAANDFAIQPEQERKPDMGPPPGPPKEPSEKKEKEDDEPKPEMPKDYVTESIIFLVVLAAETMGSVCFCWCGCMNVISFVFGILALLEAQKVKQLYGEDDYEAAQKAANEAKKWLKFGVVLLIASLLVQGIYTIIMILLKGMGFFTNVFTRGRIN